MHWTGLVLLVAAPSLVAAGTCESEWIGQAGKPSPVCRALENKPAVLQRFPDGTVLANPTVFDRRMPAEFARQARTATTSAGQLNKHKEQFESLKQSMIEQVTRGAPETSWNSQQKYLVSRLRAVNLTFENDENCRGDSRQALNGHYEQQTNSVNLCPIYSHMPAEAAMGIMAHELGHLADPCHFVDRYSFGPDLRRRPANGVEQRAALKSAANSCLQGSADLPDFQRYLARPSVGATQSVVLYPYMQGPRRDFTERLAACGVVESPAMVAPRNYEGHPYLSLISCVSRHFPEAAMSGRRAPIEASSPIQEAPYCTGHNHTKECTAEHIGVSLFQYHLAKNINAIPEARREHTLYYMKMNHCSEMAIPRKGPDQYPLSDERLKLNFQSADVRRLAGCEIDPATKSKCEIPSALTAPLGTGTRPAQSATPPAQNAPAVTR